MKKHTFNYSPSCIDREKEFPVLRMKSEITRFMCEGKKFTGLPTTEQAPNGYTIYENRGWHMVFDAVKTSKFISLTRYYISNSTYSWKEFQSHINDGNPIIERKGISRDYGSIASLKAMDQWLNIRLYPNNSIAATISLINNDTKEIRSFQIDLNNMPTTDWYSIEKAIVDVLNLEMTDYEIEQFNRWRERCNHTRDVESWSSLIREIWTEDDVQPQFLNKKGAKFAYGFLIASGMEATFLYSINGKTTEHEYLPEEWREFFPELTDERLKIAKKVAGEEFNDHRLNNACDDTSQRLLISILMANVGISDSYLKRKTDRKDANTKLWNENFDKDLQFGQCSIKRQGSVIVVSVHKARESWYNYELLFLLDVKNRTRKLLGRYDGEIKTMPLTENGISDLLYRIKPNCEAGTSTNVLVRGDLDSIVEGTTCGWLIKSARNNTLPNPEEAEQAWIQCDSEWDHASRTYIYSGISVKQWASAQDPATLHSPSWFKKLVDILMREKLVFEQLAKCGLWNIFSICIIKPEWIVSDTTVAAKNGEASLAFSVKGKSLTNSLNLRMDQLRIVDKASAHTNKDPAIRIDITAALRALNIRPQEVKALDNKTFERVVAICANKYNEYGGRTSLASRLCSRWNTEHVRKYIQTIDGVNRKLNFLEKYFLNTNPGKTENLLEHYDDYLKMRDQLKDLLIKSAAANIRGSEEELSNFDKDWPFLPEAGTMFHRYLPGIRLTIQSWGGEVRAENQSQFMDHFKRRYPASAIEKIYDDEHNFLGIILKLSASERIEQLHDDISMWLSTKKDAECEKLFAYAVKAAKKMEYINEEFGLRIIAPERPSDLKREGAVLNHCVGSYVDSVCKGLEHILFIRRTDMPSEPYFTMDVMPDGSVRQIHCYRNGNPTKDGIKAAFTQSGQAVYNEDRNILGFLMEWAKKTPGIKASSLHKQYGALCAIRN